MAHGCLDSPRVIFNAIFPLIIWIFMDIFMDMDYKIIMPARVSSDMVKLISEIDEFKGRWEALKNLTPHRLSSLRKVATIASVGSSTRIEGARLSDAEVEELLSNINRHSFRSRDEEEVAGYADAMNLVFDSPGDIPITENHIKQLHHVLLKHSTKDARHKGEYKKLPNNVEAFDATGKRGPLKALRDEHAARVALEFLITCLCVAGLHLRLLRVHSGSGFCLEAIRHETLTSVTLEALRCGVGVAHFHLLLLRGQLTLR